jgi:hypothetical protein
MEIGRWTSAVSAAALNGTAAVPFVIPSEAEGSAVRTSLGNVLDTRRGAGLGAQAFQAEERGDHRIDVFETVVKRERWADRGFEAEPA